MKKTLLISLLSITFLLTGCSQISQKPSYNQDSRKTMIPETCNTFFDGCNNCNKMENSTEAACTRMFCQTYEEPKCLDAMDPSRDKNKDGINDCESNGTCDDSINYTQPKQEITTYNQESRKTMIPETCKAFFDGCNTCNKIENEENAACTMMYCETYQQPKCLD